MDQQALALDAEPKYLTELLQNRREFEEFSKLLVAEGVRSYLEIGSMYGGSLWRITNILPEGSKVVSVDFAIDTPQARPHLQRCIDDLRGAGYEASVLFKDSMSPDTVKEVRALGPFDCVLIDGAHTLEAVTSDWRNYGPMARMVAFHDISWNETWKSKVPGRVPPKMGVPMLWKELKAKYRHKEFQYQVPCNYYGIGVLWRE